MVKENGYFKNKNITQLSKSLNIATLYNIYLNEEELNSIHKHNIIHNTIRLNPIDISLDHFLRLFYGTHSKYFKIHKSDYSTDIISFSNQTYSSNHHHKIRFLLSDEILRTYSLINNINPDNINSYSKIMSNKEAFGLQNLGQMYGTQISLDWDQVIHSLLENNYVLRSSNPLSKANVSFEIVTNIFNKSLNIWLSIIFIYQTELSGFRNANESNILNEITVTHSDNFKDYHSHNQNFHFYKSPDPKYDLEENYYTDESSLHSDKEDYYQEKNKHHDEKHKDHHNENTGEDTHFDSHIDIDSGSDSGSDNKETKTTNSSEKLDINKNIDETTENDSLIYTINNELLQKIHNVKNGSTNESVCTWIKN